MLCSSVCLGNHCNDQSARLLSTNQKNYLVKCLNSRPKTFWSVVSFMWPSIISFVSWKKKKSSWVCIWDWVVVRPQLKNAQCKFGYLMIFLLQEKPGKNAPGEIDVNLILITDWEIKQKKVMHYNAVFVMLIFENAI